MNSTKNRRGSVPRTPESVGGSACWTRFYSQSVGHAVHYHASCDTSQYHRIHAIIPRYLSIMHEDSVILLTST